jgi:hypothetical protein
MLVSCMMASVCAAENSESRATEVGNAELAAVLGTKASPTEKRVAALLAERIKDRTSDAHFRPPGRLLAFIFNE